MIAVAAVIAGCAAYLYALRQLAAPILAGNTEPDEEEERWSPTTTTGQ